MKKLGFCLLAMCLVGYAVGCGKEGDEPVNPTPPADTDTGAATEDGADAPATGDAAN